MDIKAQSMTKAQVERLIQILNEDHSKALQRQNAYYQEGNIEAASFNKATTLQASTTLFDIKMLLRGDY